MALTVCATVNQRSQRERAMENKVRVDFIMLREDMADRESMMSPDPPRRDGEDSSDDDGQDPL